MISAEEAAARLAEAEAAGRLSGAAVANIRRWLTEAPFLRYRDRLLEDIEREAWAELDDAFFTVLEFGTGGRRGKMYPVGTNVLNERTIAESARGLADYVRAKKGERAPRSCVIARDTRHHSAEFAELCARVMAAAGFRVHLFRDYRSTPLLSFAVRHLRCDAGIMITASHNPPSDNGFKCYSSTGGQVIPPDDRGIITCVEAASDREIPEKPMKEALADGSIVWAGPELDDAYIASVVSESVSHARDLAIVYTPLHGVGETSVAAALRTDGFNRVDVLESQSTPDGDFPTVPGHVANPEYPKTLEAAIEEARNRERRTRDRQRSRCRPHRRGGPGHGRSPRRVDDPRRQPDRRPARRVRDEGDRVAGAAAIRPLSRHDPGLDPNGAGALAHREGVRTEDDLLVGFKWIANRIEEAGPASFLFAFEESHGYLKGMDVRDKDASVAALLFAELAATVKDRKQTVLEYLDDLYIDVGHYAERLVTKTCEGREGHAQIKAIMEAFRSRPPDEIGGLGLTEVCDYERHEVRPLSRPGAATALPQPSGDLLIFHADRPGCRFAARPSGTEPKIKFYLFARSDVDGPDSLPAAKEETRRLLDRMEADLGRYIDDALRASS